MYEADSTNAKKYIIQYIRSFFSTIWSGIKRIGQFIVSKFKNIINKIKGSNNDKNKKDATIKKCEDAIDKSEQLNSTAKQNIDEAEAKFMAALERDPEAKAKYELIKKRSEETGKQIAERHQKAQEEIKDSLNKIFSDDSDSTVGINSDELDKIDSDLNNLLGEALVINPQYPFGQGYNYPNSDLSIDGVKIELYVSNTIWDDECEKNLELLHKNFDIIKKNYSKAKQYFVDWYNKTDDGNKISISDLKKPYCIVYYGYSNTCEFDYTISEEKYNDPYYVAMKIINKNNISYSCHEI